MRAEHLAASGAQRHIAQMLLTPEDRQAAAAVALQLRAPLLLLHTRRAAWLQGLRARTRGAGGLAAAGACLARTSLAMALRQRS